MLPTGIYGMRRTVQSGIILSTSMAVVFGGKCATTVAMKRDPSNRCISGDMMTACQSDFLVSWDIRCMVM